MKMAFAWDFEKVDGLDGWIHKDDSFQYMIKEFAKENECAIFARNAMDQNAGHEGLKYVLKKRWEDLLIEIARFNPDIIFAQGFSTPLSNAIPDFLPNTKKIVTYVGGEMSGNLLNYDVATVSREHQKLDFLKRKEEDEKKSNQKYKTIVEVVPYGANTDLFNIQEGTNRKLDVVCVAEDIPIKRLHLLKEAQKKMKDYTFSFIGSEVKVPYIYMPNIFNAAKVSAVVSMRGDGGPRVVPESLACGTPVLTCYDSEGIWSASEKFDEIGKVVMPTVDCIVEGLKTLIETCDDTMRKKCRKVVIEELSYQQMYKKYEEIVNELLGKT